MNFNRLSRRRFSGGLVAAALTTTLTTAAMAKTYTKADPLKVALVLNGTLGDKSFFDSAAEGMKQAEVSLPVHTTVIAATYDRGRWQPALADAAEGDYDVIIAGTYEMTGFVQELAIQFPTKKFIVFDDAPDFKSGKYPNILAITYRTSTASYLAGYAAAKVSKTGKIGMILGIEAGVIFEFSGGFEQGAKAANPNIVVLKATAGVFDDPAKGKELALAQFAQGVDVIFPIASSTGIGALQAAKDKGLLAVGVDSDQATIFAPTDPAQAAVILTSVEKRVGKSLVLALKATLDGSATYGKETILGIAEGAVGISRNSYYEKLVLAAVRTEIDALEAKIVKGEIKVVTAI
jgi:basic membrane protein A and related proteins